MEIWYPTAIKSQGNDAGSFVSGYSFKGVLHTTEGSSTSGALIAYRNANSWPHFTLGMDGVVYQHIPIDRAARSLENLSGGVETNRGGAIQIEIVGFASKPYAWPNIQRTALINLMRWIETQTGIKSTGLKFGSSEQYGLKNPLELTFDQWKIFSGWCGHQHVPENRHWDPGAINIYEFLPPQEIKPMFDPPLVLEPIAAYTQANGGFYQASSSGALYNFGAPQIRGANGQPWFVNRKVAELYPSNDLMVPEPFRAVGGVTIHTISDEWYTLLP